MDVNERQKNETQYAIDTVEGFASRTVSRLIKIIIALIVAWFLTIGGFVWYLFQYDYTTTVTEYAQDGQGLNIIGNENGANYYGTEAQNND